MKTIFKALTLLCITLLISCSSSKSIPVIKEQPKPTIKVKTEEYIVISDLGHKIKVELEYKVLTKNGGLKGCAVGFILTNIGDLDFKTGAFYKDKYINQEEHNRLVGLMNGEHLKVIQYNPEIIFEIKTSDGKTIEKSKHLWGGDDILVGKSSTPKTVRAEVSYASNRFCVSFKPIRIQGK